jgi:hypothetical protein
MTEVKHIIQKEKYGCAPACLAMVLGLEYDQAANLVPMGYLDNGTDMHAIISVLKKRKCRVQYRHRLAHPFAPVHIICTGPKESAIDTNIIRHLVVMTEKGTILDPADESGRYYEFPELRGYVFWTLGIHPPAPKND